MKDGDGLNTKLILVEGIPGSGKSTFAGRIATHYKAQGHQVCLYNEGDYHPTDVAWNACIPVEALEAALAPFQAFRAEIDRHLRREGDRAILPYTKVETDDPGFFPAMERYEVYDSRVPFPVFEELLLQRWSAFGRDAANRDELNVFECAFLQNHVNELMNFQLADGERMKAHCRALMGTVRGLSPVLIYLAQPNVRAAMERIAAERVSPDGSWIEGITGYLEQTPYGKQQGLRGFDGVVRAYEERQRAELEIVHSLPIPSIVLENHGNDWDGLWATLVERLPN